MRAKSSLHIRNKFLKMSCEHMSEFGLEQTSLRELCKNTGISSGSLYYWFNNKDELIIAAAEFGFDNISSRIFDCNFDDIKNIKDFFDANMSRIKKFQNQLRFIYQVATSPMYGDKLRAKVEVFNSDCEKYTQKLANSLNYPADELKPFIYMYIDTVLDFIIWNNEEKTRTQLDCIYNLIESRNK